MEALQFCNFPAVGYLEVGLGVAAIVVRISIVVDGCPLDLIHIGNSAGNAQRIPPGQAQGAGKDYGQHGKTVQRYYEIPHTGVLAEQAKMYFSDIRYLFKTNNPETLYTSLSEVTIGYYTETTYASEPTTNRAILTGLLDAIKADCELGVMAQNWLHHDGKSEYHLSFVIRTEDDDYFHKWSDMYITDDCKNTVAYLETILIE